MDEKFVEAIALAGQLLQEYEQYYQQKQAAQQAAYAEMPATVEALISRGLVVPEERSDLIQALSDHSQTLRLLQKTAQFVPSPPDRLGRPVDQELSKSAGLEPRYRGGRRDGKPTPAWLRSQEVLGL